MKIAMIKSKLVPFSLSSLLLILPILTSCEKPPTDDPVSALNGLVKEYGYIGYQNPLESSGTGTLLGGRPTSLAFVGHAQNCFSSESIERHYDYSNIRKKYNYSFQGNLGFLAFGTPIISGGLGLNKTHTVDIELNGITMEYMSSIDVTEHYQNNMSDICKDSLNEVGFSIQALITDSLKISIKKTGGINIGINADNVASFFDIEAGVDWQIVDEYTIEIKTPKYIGYQLGRLRLEDEGRVLYRAMSTQEDKFVFEAITLFPDDETNPAPKSIVRRDDEEDIYLK
jgi:hypothetical protein